MTISTVRDDFYWTGFLRFFAICLLVTASCALGDARVELNVPNADFDSGIEGWSERSETELSWESGEDFEGDPESGALRIRQVPKAFGSAQAQSACFRIDAGTYDAGARIFVDGAQAGDFRVLIQLHVFAQSDCTGPVTISGSNNFVGATDSWIVKNTGAKSIPSNAVSAYLLMPVFNGSREPFEVLADGFFVIDTDRIFVDRFEQ